MKKIVKRFKKEPIFSIVLLFCLLVLMGTVTVFAADTVVKSGLISEELAKKFAFLDAGVQESEVRHVEAELEREGFQYSYEVEFQTDEAEYSYAIRAMDGRVLDKNKRIISNMRSMTSSTEKKAEDKPYISVDEAKKIALMHAGADALDVSFSKAKLEKSDGRACYEIEFYTNNYEFEYEIGAYDGEILESSKEAQEQEGLNQETEDSRDSTDEKDRLDKKDSTLQDGSGNNQSDKTQQNEETLQPAKHKLSGDENSKGGMDSAREDKDDLEDVEDDGEDDPEEVEGEDKDDPEEGEDDEDDEEDGDDEDMLKND